MKEWSIVFISVLFAANSIAQTNSFPSTGNVGIGTTSPGAKLSFNNLNDGSDAADGITWYNTTPLNYCIYRTAGTWLSPNYQQLKINFETGIILNPGSVYGRSFVEVQGGGLRVTSGNVGIGTTSPSSTLHLKSSGSNPLWLSLDKTAGTETGVHFMKSGAHLFHFYSDNDDSDALKIQAHGLTGENDGAPRILIPQDNKNLYLGLSGGNVAIGHRTPGYKLDVYAPSGSWKARFHGEDGYILMGPANDGWAHIYTDRPAFIFNQGIWSTPGIFSSYGQADLSLQTNGVTRVTVSKATGNVGVGTTSPNEKLAVNGTIYGKEVKVDLSVPGPDYVFAKDYKLPSLQEVQIYINQHSHLPEIPSAKEMEAEGIKVGEMNMLLLKKVEELTLYLIQQQNEIEALKKALHDKK